MDEKKNNTEERPAPKAPENAPVRRVGTRSHCSAYP